MHLTSPLSETYSVYIVFLIFYVSLSALITAYDNYSEEVAVAGKLGITVETPYTAAAATEALKTLNVA